MTESERVIEVFADITCPFTHVGLRRLVDRRRELGRDDVRFRVRAWPLELVNGSPMGPTAVGEKVDLLRREVAPDLFAGFDADHFPATSLPALMLAGRAEEHGLEVAEQANLRLRDALFEHGQDIGDPRVLARIAAEVGVTPDPTSHGRSHVLADWREGRQRGVIGSPHFFVGDEGFFCPSLDIERVDGVLQVAFDRPRFERFADACFAA
jgi:predicted DsbA family dithiol-disulfide isomerase